MLFKLVSPNLEKQAENLIKHLKLKFPLFKTLL